MRDSGETPPLAPPARLQAPILFALALLARGHVVASPDALVLGWRQADMLSVTRNFGRNGFRLLWPQVDWGGAGPGYAEMEFPILPWIGALLQRALGPHELLPALVPLLASFGLVFAIAALARRVLGPAVGFWAGVFAALSPAAAWATATFQPDGTMLLSSVLGVLFLARWSDSGRAADLVLSGAFTSLAILLKPTALFAGLPLLTLFLARWGRSTPRRAAFWLYGLLVLVPPALWYAHAHGLYVAYGNTFGVLSGGYGKLSSLALLSRPVFWLRIGSRTALYLLTPAVAVLFAAGLALRPPGRAGRLFHVWTAALLVYVVAVGRGNFDMSYYQLPFLAPGCALAGAAAVALLERLARARHARALTFGAAAALLLGVAAGTAIHGRRVVASSLAQERLLRANGREVARVTPPGALLLVATGYGGSRPPATLDTPPQIFAHADRRGWFSGLYWLTPAAVAARRREGAQALVVPAEDLPLFRGPNADALRALYPPLPTESGVLVLDLARRAAPDPTLPR
jgi:4-amino-4-deoxy-L-arabinose transferase-like glycosyltransferase